VAPSDLLLGTGYKYSYLLTYLLTIIEMNSVIMMVL